MNRGRPREFDPEAALDQALPVFVQLGFEAASVQQLADAMGICKPSLYAAYGNKEALFIAVLQRYAARHEMHRAALLDAAPDGATAVHRMLLDAAETYTRCTTSLGCMLVGTASASAASLSPDVRDALAAAMSDGSAQLHSRLERAQRDGDLDAEEDVEALTAYFLTVMAGLSVQARSGATAAQLRRIVDASMRAWPTSAGVQTLTPARPSRSSASRGRTASLS